MCRCSKAQCMHSTMSRCGHHRPRCPPMWIPCQLVESAVIQHRFCTATYQPWPPNTSEDSCWTAMTGRCMPPDSNSRMCWTSNIQSWCSNRRGDSNRYLCCWGCKTAHFSPVYRQATSIYHQLQHRHRSRKYWLQGWRP